METPYIKIEKVEEKTKKREKKVYRRG